jgi:DUF1680 family protein
MTKTKAFLYRSEVTPRKSVAIKAVPYDVWTNRQPGEMLVWIQSQ